MSEFLLSVCIRAYNQEKYIGEAVESALMQKTTFPFEIIIADDVSTDSTLQTLEKFQSKYPDKIRVLSGESNLGGTLNLKRVLEASEARYIALCDGDDYWTDPYKLQKQVDFLEENFEYVGCFHNVLNCWEHEDNNLTLFNPLNFPKHHDYESLVLRDWFLPTNAEVFRRDKLFFPSWYKDVMNDDYVVNLALAKSGPFFYMPDIMAVYRHNAGSESRSYSDRIFLNEKLLFIIENMKMEYPLETHAAFNQKIESLSSETRYLKKEKKYPLRKYLRLKTYKKMLGKWLNIQRRESI